MKNSGKHLPLVKLPKNAKFFGGSLLYGRRKTQRPLCGNHALHLVLKSQWATERNSFTHSDNKLAVTQLIHNTARKYGVRIYRFAIVHDHIHILLRSKRRWLYRAFIGCLTGQIAQHVMKNQNFNTFLELKLKAIRGEGFKTLIKQHKEQKFWLHRPFSRIVSWGRDYANCMGYIAQNSLEALGLIEYKPRRDYYEKWRLSLNPT